MVGVIGTDEAHQLLAFGADFQPVHGEVEVTTDQAVKQLVELVLLERDRAVQFLGEGGGQVYLEADEFVGVVLVAVDVGHAAFKVGAPLEWFACFLGNEWAGEAGEKQEGNGVFHSRPPFCRLRRCTKMQRRKRRNCQPICFFAAAANSSRYCSESRSF